MDNQTDFYPDMTKIQTLLEVLGGGEVELLICSDDAIRALNREHRSIDKATDVLSFPCEPMPMVPLGSIVISVDHVRAGAQQYGHSENDECALLFLHGLLHLKGFDHEADAGEMREKERELIGMLGLPESLIVRAEGEH